MKASGVVSDMGRRISETNVNLTFERLQDIAIRGERCPFNDALPSGALSVLARSGRIRIEVFRHNWRVVTIMTGPHSGQQTMRDPAMPTFAKPYVVIDSTTSVRRSNIPPSNRCTPWKPGTPRPAKEPRQ